MASEDTRNRATYLKARRRLRMVIDAACLARGRAEWTNGYRAGSESDDQDYWNKEMAQWREVSVVEKRVDRAIGDFVRAVRAKR